MSGRGEPGSTPRLVGLYQFQAGFALLHAPRSSAGGSFLKTVLKDSSTFDWTTGSDCTPTQAGVVLPRRAFIIAIASATPWSYGRCEPVAFKGPPLAISIADWSP